MLNEKACAVYEYIRRQSEQGIPPTVREIGAALEIRSTSTVHRYVKILVDEGYLEKFGNQNRALRLTGVQGIRVPLLRSVSPACGLLSVENVRRYVSFDAQTTESGTLFAWEVRSEDRVPSFLSAGDIVIAEQADSLAENAYGLFCTEDTAQIGQNTEGTEMLGQLVAMIRKF